VNVIGSVAAHDTRPPFLPLVPPSVLDRVRLLEGGDEAFPRMLDAIANARESVFLEVYGFKRDRVGEQFIAALSEAANRGVRVRCVLDGWGSVRDGEEIAGLLRDAGCEADIYNPLRTMLLGRFKRNHRKLLVVDDEVAFLGGINIGEEYGSRMGWADLAVELRGPVSGWLGRKLRGETPGQVDPAVRVYLSGFGGGRRLRKRYLKAIGSAERTLLIVNAYFLPDRRLMRSLRAAARRGVAVTLLVPGNSDVLFAREATRRLYGSMLAAGVRIHEWNRTVLHAKAAVVDGQLALVGSFNLDPYSMENLEALVEVHDAQVAGRLEACLRAWEARATPVRMVHVARRTWLDRVVLEATGGLAAAVATKVARLLRGAVRRGPRVKPEPGPER
jgi:cardiolipin synthase